jgi:hypothetical protein
MKTIKIIFLYLFFGLSFLNSLGQQIGNYVSNGSFESLNSYSISSYYNVVNYWQPIDTNQFADYLGTNLSPIANVPYVYGFQYPRTGNNYIGTQFYNFRGYPRNRLKEHLKPNVTYCAKYYIVNTNNNPIATDGAGMYFASSTLDTITQCNIALYYLTPQIQNQPGNIITDTLNWIPITGTFVATGNEKYLVIGNFKTDAATNTLLINPTYSTIITSDVLIDDVSVIEFNLPAYAGKDTTIYLGDSLFIGRQPDFATDTGCVWYKLPNMTTSLDTISGIWVKPTTTSTYVVRQVLDCSPLKWDTVVVTVSTNYVGLDKLQNLSDNINLFPNPTSGNLSISGFIGSDIITFSISNCLGQNVLNGDIILKNNSIIIETSELESGLYQIHLKTQYGIVTKKFVKTN